MIIRHIQAELEGASSDHLKDIGKELISFDGSYRDNTHMRKLIDRLEKEIANPAIMAESLVKDAIVKRFVIS